MRKNRSFSRRLAIVRYLESRVYRAKVSWSRVMLIKAWKATFGGI